MYVRKYTTKLVLNSWLSYDWNIYEYVHILSTIEIFLEWRNCFFFTPESRSGEGTKLGGSPQHWKLIYITLEAESEPLLVAALRAAEPRAVKVMRLYQPCM